MKKQLFVILFFSIFTFVNLAESQTSNTKYVSTKAGLRLRSNPDKSSQVVTMLKYGELVFIQKEDPNMIFMDGRYGKWVNVKVGTKKGWVFSGFLCDFKPDAVIKEVANFYRNKYNQYKFHSIEQRDEFTKFKDNKVSIITIIDTYINLEIPTGSNSGDISKGNVIWKYDVNLKKFSEVYNPYEQQHLDLFYIDSDEYPDLVSNYYEETKVLLGSENGFNEKFKTECDEEYYQMTTGQCENMIIVCRKYSSDDKNRFNYHYKFNCSKNNIDLIAEAEVISASGYVTSINISAKTIIIRLKKTNEVKTFILSDNVKVRNGLKSVNDIIINDYIVFSYELLNDQNIIIDIYPQR